MKAKHLEVPLGKTAILRERERDRETERETERERQRETERQRERDRERKRERKRGRKEREIILKLDHQKYNHTNPPLLT